MSETVHRNSRLTADQVREIRRLGRDPCPCCGCKMSRLAIGKRFGISGPAVHHIIKGRNHARIGERR